MNKSTEIIGYFTQSYTKYVCYDDDRKIIVQTTEDISANDFMKLKKSLLNKQLTIKNESGDLSYDYMVERIMPLDNNSFEIYYKYRILRINNRDCHNIIFNSSDIDIFGQNRTLFNEIYQSITTKVFNIPSLSFSGSFNYRSKEYTIKIANNLPIPAEMKTRISLMTLLSIGSENPMDNNTIFDFFKIVRRFLSFLTYRKNIDFNFIELQDQTGMLAGELYVPQCKSNHVFNNYPDNQMIKNDAVGQNLSKLISAIANEVIHCDHIPNESDSDYSTFINTAAWLEDYFREFAKDTNDKYIIEDDTVKHAVRGQGAKYHKKVTFQETIAALREDSEEYCSATIDQYLSAYFISETTLKNYKSGFTTRIKEIRNDFCHGKGKYSKEYFDFFEIDLKVFQIILYASILKHIGFDKESTEKALHQLFLCQDEVINIFAINEISKNHY